MASSCMSVSVGNASLSGVTFNLFSSLISAIYRLLVTVGREQVGLQCSGNLARACNESLGFSSSGAYNASSSSSSESSFMSGNVADINASALAELNLYPEEGVTDAGGYTIVSNVSAAQPLLTSAWSARVDLLLGSTHKAFVTMH